MKIIATQTRIFKERENLENFIFEHVPVLKNKTILVSSARGKLLVLPKNSFATAERLRKAVLEPRWKIVGQILYPRGKKRYFRYSSLDLNTLGASEISKDKDRANFFMKRRGYPTRHGKTFFSSAWAEAIGSPRDIDAAYRYTQMIGFPIIVNQIAVAMARGSASICLITRICLLEAMLLM